MANISDLSRDAWMLKGPLAEKGYDWWWHSFTAERADTGERKPFYIEFFTCNPALAGDEPRFAWHLPALTRGDARPSYLMVNVGFWGEEKGQLHRFFAWKDVRVREGVPYEIGAADCFCCETHTRGSVNVSPEDALAHPEWMSDAGSLTWDLAIDKKVAFHVGYGADEFFRERAAFEMFWHAEGMKTAYSGELTLNGVRYVVRPETCYGYADKNWGADFTSPWVWLSSNDLVSRLTGERLRDSVFEIGGGRPKAFGVALERKLLGAFWYEGKNYEFNFSKFWTRSETEFDCHETADEIVWHVVQTTLAARLETDIRCKKRDMLLIRYESPAGEMRHEKLWNGGNGYGTLRLYERRGGEDVLIDEVAAESVGCEYGEYN